MTGFVVQDHVYNFDYLTSFQFLNVVVVCYVIIVIPILFREIPYELVTFVIITFLACLQKCENSSTFPSNCSDYKTKSSLVKWMCFFIGGIINTILLHTALFTYFIPSKFIFGLTDFSSDENEIYLHLCSIINVIFFFHSWVSVVIHEWKKISHNPVITP